MTTPIGERAFAVAVATVLLPLIGCARGATRNATLDAMTPLADAGSSDAGSVDDGGADASDAGDAAKKPSCGPTVLQPHACVSSHADLTLDNDPIHAWFQARDTIIDDYVFVVVPRRRVRARRRACARLRQDGTAGHDWPRRTGGAPLRS